MNLKISARDSRHTDTKVHLYAICSQWLPLAKAVLEMTVDHLPSPLQLSREKVERLMSSTARTFESFPTKTACLAEDFLACSSASSAPTIAFVSKLFVVDKTTLPHYQNRFGIATILHSCCIIVTLLLSLKRLCVCLCVCVCVCYHRAISHDSRPLTEEEIKQRRQLARLRHLAQVATNQDEPLIEVVNDGTPMDGQYLCEREIITFLFASLEMFVSFNHDCRLSS